MFFTFAVKARGHRFRLGCQQFPLKPPLRKSSQGTPEKRVLHPEISTGIPEKRVATPRNPLPIPLGKILQRELLKSEYPKQTKVLLKALDDFSLPKGLSMSDCEILMALARMYEVDDSIFPLIETSLQDLVAPDNAYYLYFLGSDAKMPDLRDTCLNTIEKFLDIDTAFEIMKELTKKNQKNCQNLIDICLGFVISQIPKYGKSEKSKSIMKQLLPYLPSIVHFLSNDLHAVFGILKSRTDAV